MSYTFKDDKNRLIYGFTAPLLILVGIASLIVMTDSGAVDGGFAPLLILVMTIVAVPVVVVANMIIVPVRSPANAAYFVRGMIFPGIFVAAMLIYSTGTWDEVIEPLLPQRVDKIQTASSSRIGDDVYESFYVVADYSGSAEDLSAIDSYIREYFERRTWEYSGYAELNMSHYFVPTESYDPIDDAISRQRAVAVYRHQVIDGEHELVRIEPAND